MISAIVLVTLLNVGELLAIPPEEPRIEARRRGRSQKGRRRGGSGLR